MKNLLDLRSYVAEVQEKTAKAQRNASQTGNPSMERFYHGCSTAYIDCLQSLDKLIEAREGESCTE